jgi:hypothetical protein
MEHKVKPKPGTKPDNPEQYRRFVETAREAEADESPDALDRAFERVVGKPKPKDESAPASRPKRR